MTDQKFRPAVDPALLRGMTQRRISRRDLFRYAGAGAGALGLSAFLEACGVGGGNTSKSPAPTGTQLQQELKKIYDDGKPAGELIWANWPLYIDVTSKGNSPTIDKFEKATGIKVTYKTVISDNTPFLAKIIPVLQSGQGTGYDLIVVTNGGGIEPLLRLGFLTPLDHKYIPNFYKYASQPVRSPAYDPGNKYSVAWQSGFTGIGYNSKFVKEKPKSFGDLLNPKYKGKVGVFGNNQDLPVAALEYMGFDGQKSTPDQWKKTADMLMRARDKNQFRGFFDQSYIDKLENEDTIITQAWSGDIFIAAAPKSVGGDGFPEMRLVLPKEGALIWTDNMCIPLHAQHPVDAIMMMNFVYQPPIAAELADFIWYVSPVPAAKDIVLHKIKDPAVADSPLVFPTSADLAKTHQYKVFKDHAEEEEWNSIWEPVYT
jgi:spermidine/putrescine transport system substrate-binding protein